MTLRPLSRTIALALCLVVPAGVLAQDATVEERLEALERLLQQQQEAMDADRARMEETIRDQQKELDRQKDQLSAQYELIRKLQD